MINSELSAKLIVFLLLMLITHAVDQTTDNRRVNWWRNCKNCLESTRLLTLSRGGWHTTRLTVSRQFRTSWITWSRGALSRKYLDTITENIWDGKILWAVSSTWPRPRRWWRESGRRAWACPRWGRRRSRTWDREQFSAQLRRVCWINNSELGI